MPRTSPVSDAVWARAVHAVTVQKMSLRRAAQLYGVHHMSLHRRVRGQYVSPATARFAGEFRLAQAVEAEALSVLREQFRNEHRVSTDDVRYVVRTIAAQGGRLEMPADFPPTRWVARFRRAHGFAPDRREAAAGATTDVADDDGAVAMDDGDAVGMDGGGDFGETGDDGDEMRRRDERVSGYDDDDDYDSSHRRYQSCEGVQRECGTDNDGGGSSGTGAGVGAERERGFSSGFVDVSRAPQQYYYEHQSDSEHQYRYEHEQAQHEQQQRERLRQSHRSSQSSSPSLQLSNAQRADNTRYLLPPSAPLPAFAFTHQAATAGREGGGGGSASSFVAVATHASHAYGDQERYSKSGRGVEKSVDGVGAGAGRSDSGAQDCDMSASDSDGDGACKSDSASEGDDEFGRSRDSSGGGFVDAMREARYSREHDRQHRQQERYAQWEQQHQRRLVGELQLRYQYPHKQQQQQNEQMHFSVGAQSAQAREQVADRLLQQLRTKQEREDSQYRHEQLRLLQQQQQQQRAEGQQTHQVEQPPQWGGEQQRGLVQQHTGPQQHQQHLQHDGGQSKHKHKQQQQQQQQNPLDEHHAQEPTGMVSDETWEKAMDAVEIHGMSLRNAAKAHGVHFAALYRRLKKRALTKQSTPPLEDYIPFEDEAGIVRVVRARADMGVVMSYEELVDLLERTALKYASPPLSPDFTRALVRRFESRVEQTIRPLVRDWQSLPHLGGNYHVHSSLPSTPQPLRPSLSLSLSSSSSPLLSLAAARVSSPFAPVATPESAAKSSAPFQPPISTRRPSLLLAKALLFGGVLLVILSALYGTVLPTVIDKKIKSGVVTCSLGDAGEDFFDPYGDCDDCTPYYYTMRMFNITNPEQYLRGTASKLALKESGAYVYRRRQIKVDVTFDDNNRVSYKQYSYHTFEPSLSCAGCSESDMYTSLDVGYLSVLGSAGGEFAFLMGLVNGTFGKGMTDAALAALVRSNGTQMMRWVNGLNSLDPVAMKTVGDSVAGFLLSGVRAIAGLNLTGFAYNGLFVRRTAKQWAIGYPSMLVGLGLGSAYVGDCTTGPNVLAKCKTCKGDECLAIWSECKQCQLAASVVAANDAACAAIEGIMAKSYGDAAGKAFGATTCRLCADLGLCAAPLPGIAEGSGMDWSQGAPPSAMLNTYVQQTGCKNLSAMGEYEQYDGYSSVALWAKLESRRNPTLAELQAFAKYGNCANPTANLTCSPVRGGDATGVYPGGASSSGFADTVMVRVSQMYMDQGKQEIALYNLDEELEYEGIPLHRFGPAVDLLNRTAANDAMGTGYPVNGVQPMSFTTGFLSYVSYPLFLYGDASLLDAIDLTVSDGAAPVRKAGMLTSGGNLTQPMTDKYVTYLDIEAGTGKTMRARKRLMASYALSKSLVNGSAAMTDVLWPRLPTEVIVPSYWGEESATIAQKQIDSYLSVKRLLASLIPVLVAGIIVGVILAGVGFARRRSIVRKQRHLSIDMI
ncbi:hypothetical protein PybrP1_003019 [[Pythium] brassicae (nom. inval.)]|nr:hypothetical protein PybrP1_003019 [[Pythium] brassicae (nom. inval.)]